MRLRQLLTSDHQPQARSPACDVLLPALLLLFSASFAGAADRVPQPDFESGYVHPEQVHPGPAAVWEEYVAVVVLAAAMGLAAWLVLKKRSRGGVSLLMIACLVYFGLVRTGCICPVGSVQNLVLGITSSGYAVPVFVTLIFVLPLLFTLFLGRVFCAAVCPLGAVQDVVVLRPTPLPQWLGQALGMIPWFFLGFAVLLVWCGAGFWICKIDPFVSFFRLSGPPANLIGGGALLLLGIFVARPYCRFLCPYGVLLNLASRFSKWHLTITPDECVQCRLCETACPFDAIRVPAAEPATEPLTRGEGRLIRMLLLVPVFVVLGMGLGRSLRVPLSRLHPKVWLAEALLARDNDPDHVVSLEEEAFHESGEPVAQLYRDALGIRDRFQTGGMWLGGVFGLLVGLKLVGLSTRRAREDYEPDRGTCLSCGRCFAACPRERLRWQEKKET